MTLIPFNDLYDHELRDPEYVAGYLAVSAEEDGQHGFLRALRNVVRANGGMAKLAETTGLNRENLFRALSKEGDPKLSTVLSILRALGLQISVTTVGALAAEMAASFTAEQAEEAKELVTAG